LIRAFVNRGIPRALRCLEVVGPAIRSKLSVENGIGFFSSMLGDVPIIAREDLLASKLCGQIEQEEIKDKE
jgi:hypothetical protein